MSCRKLLDSHRSQVRRHALYVLALLLNLVTAPLAAAQTEALYPTASFTARLIRGVNVLFGATPEREGTAWLSLFLEIKEGTSDRTVLEYDLRGRSPAVSATLNLELANSDDPDFTTIFLYSFDGNGLANAADYFRTDKFVTSFTDNGQAGNSYMPFSFDLTAVYNQAITNGDDYLGLILKNTTAEAKYARYYLSSDRHPTLVVRIPEPSSLGLTAICLSIVVGCHCRLKMRYR